MGFKTETTSPGPDTDLIASILRALVYQENSLVAGDKTKNLILIFCDALEDSDRIVIDRTLPMTEPDPASRPSG